jgi:hypothetical protein
VESMRAPIRADRLAAWALGVLLLAASAAFAQTDPLPSWNDGPAKQSIIAFVERVTTPGSPDFVPEMTGANFNPHVSTGVAPKDYLDKMLAEPFESFTFSPAGAAVYQLGPFGTAAKQLAEWNLKP